MGVGRNRVCFIFLLVLLKVTCYEKTLRKIVRNQSKMVQRPFSDIRGGNDIVWRNISLEPSDALMFSGVTQSKTKIHKMQRPKISTMLSSMDSGTYGKTAYSNSKFKKNENMSPNELRQTRNTLNNLTVMIPTSTEGVLFPDRNALDQESNKTYTEEISIDTYYEIPPQTNSKYFSPRNKLTNAVEGIDTKDTILIPASMPKDNSSSLVKGIFIANSELNVKPISPTSTQAIDFGSDIETDRVDFLIQGKPVDSGFGTYSYNVTKNMYACTYMQPSKTDIDAQDKFNEIDIEPSWTTKKHYWNRIFDSRYETLMRNPKWPALKVILIPRTHVDSVWKRTFEKYHNDTVHNILSNIVKKLQFYTNLTFSWNEVSHLSQWWKTTTSKSRSALRRLLREGRFEITTGGWVESDEATTHIFGLVHQLIEGHQWLKNNLNYLPEIAWLTNTVTHSPTMSYLLSASGISNLVLTNLHYSWEEYFAEYQYSDFVWVQNWDNDIFSYSKLNTVLGRIGSERFPKHSMLTHYLQFNSAGFKACGPSQAICVTDFNFFKNNLNPDSVTQKVKEKSELLLEQYSKTGTITSHNIIMAPLGGPYHYEMQAEFDYQYNNYQKLADYINANHDIYKATVEFGTAKDYFTAVIKKQKYYPSLKGDFLNFADLSSGRPAYWTGFFTSRPLFKILLRRLQTTLRSTEILFSFGLSVNGFQRFNTSMFDLLLQAREVVARLQDRNVASGTLTANTVKYVYRQILDTVKNCWYIQEAIASLLSVKPESTIHSPYLQKYVYRDGEFISIFRSVSPGDQVYIFNSLCNERTEVVELIVRNPNVRIIDHNKKEVTIQINPVWKYNSDNFIRISRRFYKVTFAIIIPPMTLELYRIKETYDNTQNAAVIYCTACITENITGGGNVFPFNIQPVETGDIQLESYKQRLIFDEHTGFLKHVVEKVSGLEKTVVIDYGAFRSSDINSGMFLFNTNVSKPLRDILMPYRIGMKSKVLIIISGQVTTELTTVFGRFLRSTVKIYNLLNSPLSSAIYVESRVDYEVSPKNREVELFMSVQTDISNGNPPEIFTDNNGFQYTSRILNISRRVESNMYPITTMSYIQDKKSRITIITDHAQGVTALQEGQLLLMLDRRVLFNDGRGTNEGLADSSTTCHRHLIILENFMKDDEYHFSRNSHIQLPSLSAIHLAESLNYPLDIFIIDKNKTNLCYYTFLPLVKTSFPCDLALINYRVIFNKGLLQGIPSTALMILHKQSVSCQIENDLVLHCNGDRIFSLDKVLHNIKAVFHTNLAGTNKGIPITNFNHIKLPPLEITTLRIHF